MYVDQDKKIYKYDRAKVLLTLQDRYANLVENIKNLYNGKTGFFFQEVEL